MSNRPLHIIQVGTMMPFLNYYKKGPSPWISHPYNIPGRLFRFKKGPPMFTQKHYVALADLIHKRRVYIKKSGSEGETFDQTESRIDELNTLVLALSAIFEKDNPKFKKFTFIEACNRDLKDA